jgi:hypothetical protein
VDIGMPAGAGPQAECGAGPEAERGTGPQGDHRTGYPAEGPAERQTWCPSADPDRPESVVLGVQSPDRDTVVYLADPIPAAQAAAMVPEGIDPRRILRFAAHCDRACPNNAAGDCTLIERLQAVPVRAEHAGSIPRCHLRQDCQWWAQAGLEACRRCPALVTVRTAGDEFGELVADPATTRADLEAWIAANPTAQARAGS